MIAALFLALQVAPAPAPTTALPPQDWSALPPLRYDRPAADDAALTTFVRSEVKAGRCAAVRQVSNGWSLAVDVAVFVQPDGQVRRTIPRAIDCPSVEQYAAGIVFSRARSNVQDDAATGGGWYRTTLTFTWP